MVEVKIKCIHYESEKVVKMGYQKNGTPRCKCKDCGKTFQTKYVNNGAKPETKKMIVKCLLMDPIFVIPLEFWA